MAKTQQLSIPEMESMSVADNDRMSIFQVADMAEYSNEILQAVRDTVVEPYPKKTAPKFKASQIQNRLGMTKGQFNHALSKPGLDLPEPDIEDGRTMRYYSLENTIKLLNILGNQKKRPAGKKGKVLGVALYKGGAGKTTVSVALAQALTLKGLKVLLIDTDGQASATELMGFSPSEHVRDENQTILPAFRELPGSEGNSLLNATRPTYWHNLDIITASSKISETELAISECIAMNYSDRQSYIPFWRFLTKPFEELREHYDAIIVDTPPQLSNTTLNVLYSVDAILSPLPPAAMDFAGSAHFWWLFSELASVLAKHEVKNGLAAEKSYDFINIVLTKVTSSPVAQDMIEVISRAYPGKVLPVQIAESRAVADAHRRFSTIYDTVVPTVSNDTYQRALEPMDRLTDIIYNKLTKHWEQ